MSTAPVPLPPRQSNATWWVLGIFGVALCALIFAGLNIASFIADRTQVVASGKRVEISTPAGKIELDKGAGRTAGLPVYPGAMPKGSDGARIEFPTADGDKVALDAAKYYTSDSLDKVAAWYTERLGTRFRRQALASDTGALIHLDVNDADVSYISDDGDAVRIVGLTQRGDGVEIGLARMGKAEVQ
jgi:hypothetical protein